MKLQKWQKVIMLVTVMVMGWSGTAVFAVEEHIQIDDVSVGEVGTTIYGEYRYQIDVALEFEIEHIENGSVVGYTIVSTPEISEQQIDDSQYSWTALLPVEIGPNDEITLTAHFHEGPSIIVFYDMNPADNGPSCSAEGCD